MKKIGNFLNFVSRHVEKVAFATFVIITLSAISAAAQTCAPPPTGLVSWWRAESDATDAVGNNNGILLGAGFAAGEVGQAFTLNGSQYVQLPGGASLNPSGSFTIEGWIYPAPSGAGQVIFSKWGDEGDYSN